MCQGIRNAALAPEAEGMNAQGEGTMLSVGTHIHSQTQKKGAVACEYLSKLRKQEVSVRHWGCVCVCVCALMGLLLEN